MQVRHWIVGGTVGLVLVAVWLFATDPARVLNVGDEQLGSSLSREIDGTGGDCTRQLDREWYWCGVETDPGSGYGATYRLVADDSGCWTARAARVRTVRKKPRLVRVEPTGGSKHLSGCVGLFDFVFPDSAYGSGSPADQLPLRARG